MNNDHLCDLCLDEFPTCRPGKILFGIDRDPSLAFHKDADRVLECEGYMGNLPEIPEGVTR